MFFFDFRLINRFNGYTKSLETKYQRNSVVQMTQIFYLNIFLFSLKFTLFLFSLSFLTYLSSRRFAHTQVQLGLIVSLDIKRVVIVRRWDEEASKPITE